MQVHVFMCVEARIQPWVSFLRGPFYFCLVFETRFFTGLRLVDWLDRLASPRDTPVSISLVSGLQGYITMPSFFIWILKIAFRSSCLNSKHFANWVIFPASCF